jgi:hypothetical protein
MSKSDWIGWTVRSKALNANRNTIATRLSQMVRTGEIKKASKGYVTT